MCYNVASLTKKAQHYEQRYKARFLDEPSGPLFHSKAFDYPNVPVITSHDPAAIRLFTWGLIPYWCKDAASAESIRNKTGNARGDSIFEKSSFRTAIIKRRCLVLVDGFFEFHHFQKKVYPFFIRRKDGESFALAGIWEKWDKIPGLKRNTFSIVTTDANSLMSRIHNKNPEDPRMPVILHPEAERIWIDPSLDKTGISDLIKPLAEDEFEAFPVDSITQRNKNTNCPEILEVKNYPELSI
jgi:putative SOS response-associated peptidase YedK